MQLLPTYFLIDGRWYFVIRFAAVIVASFVAPVFQQYASSIFSDAETQFICELCNLASQDFPDVLRSNAVVVFLHHIHDQIVDVYIAIRVRCKFSFFT